jgi:hypothetical protein
MLYAPAFAQTVDMPYLKNARPFISTTTLFNAVTATGAGTAVPIGIPFTKFTCVNTWGGTVPTNEVVDLEGSLDNSVWVQLVRTTVTASPTIYSTSGGHAVFYIRGNYISKSGGDGTTSVTMKCTAIYN